MRQTLECSGGVSWLEDRLIDDRRPGSVVHSMGNRMRTCRLLLCLGHRDQDDADRLRHDPALAAAAKSSGGPVRGDGSDGLPSQPTLSRFVDRLSGEENLDVLKEGILANGLRRIPEVCRGPADVLVVDVDDVPFLADGHQPGSQYCGYVGHRCYSALVAVSGESENILGAPPRRPGEDKAGETFDYVPIVAGALEERDERTVFHEHEYQAWNWSCKRRVALGVTFSERELIPRHFWLITSLAREDVGAEEFLARYRVRGKAENTFGELKSTLRAQLPSSPRPKRQYAGKTIDRSDLPAETDWRPQNEALLLLALLACQTMHEGRCAIQDASGKGWSVGTFREKALRAGCRVVRHARRMKFYITRSVASHWAILPQRLQKSAMQDA